MTYQTIVSGIFLSLIASAAPADLLMPVAQDRSVSASARIGHPPQPVCNRNESVQATDFGRFDRTVGVSCSQVHGQATQRSEFLADGTVAQGSASGNSAANGTRGTGASNFELTFSIAAPLTYTLAGQIDANTVPPDGFNTASATVELVGVFFESVSEMDSRTFSVNGELVAGQYTIRASAAGNVLGPGSGEASFSLEFALHERCPGNLNGDDSVGLSDLAILLAHFGTPSGANYADGDLDADGDVDLGDLSFLLANFGAVCL